MKSRRSRAEIVELVQSTMPWEDVGVDMLSQKELTVFRHRKDALTRYMEGQSLAVIKQHTKIGGNYLIKMINRCLKPAPDGQPFGYRAMLPNEATTEYTRTKPLNAEVHLNGAGLAGALGSLFKVYPDLKPFLDALILKKSRANKELKTVPEFAIRRKDVHRLFIKYLEERNHSKVTWPFTSKVFAFRTISGYVKKTRAQNFERSVEIIGNRAAVAHIPVGTGESPLIKLRGLWDGIEIDSHTYDAVFVLSIPNDVEASHANLRAVIELKRLHVLAAVEISSTAVLWYRVIYGDDVTAEDVVALIREMFGAERPVPMPVINDLILKNGAGFPADLIPGLKQALPSVIRFDNALANLSVKVSSSLRKQLGCMMDYGRAAHFERRPNIENLFGRFTEDLCKRFPSTTGAGPDKGGADNPGKEARIHYMESTALDQLTYTWFANHNVEPSKGLYYQTPLQALEQLIKSNNDHFIPRYPPLDKQKALGTVHVPEFRVVCADLDSGLRPYINLDGARYSSRRLKDATDLIGKKILIHVNESDMRVVQAFYVTGEPLGPLKVQGAWDQRAHTRKVRKKINSLKRLKIISYLSGECPVDVYLRYLYAKAEKMRLAGKQDRSSASKIERLQHEISRPLPEIYQQSDVLELPAPMVPEEEIPRRAWTVSTSEVDLLELLKKL